MSSSNNPKKPRRPRYASHEEQARELLENICRRDQRVAEALVDVLTSATPRVLTAVGLIVDFVARKEDPVIPDEAALRAFLARILGWASGERAQAIEQALRSIQLAVTYRTVLVLLGDPYLVSIAQSLHRLTVGAGPFVMCNPLRRTTGASARLPMSRTSGVDALRAAVGGSLCLHETRKPRDLALLAAMARDPALPVQIIVLARASYELHPFLFRPSPVWIPPLATRVNEIPRIIDAYAADAIEELSAQETGFAASDRAWVYGHSASTLSEIEKGTRRLVALRQAGSVLPAARRLEMSHVALAKWLKRRGWRPGRWS